MKKVQHYRMTFDAKDVSPGQAVFPGNRSSRVCGFIWKFDPGTRVADVLLFAPMHMQIHPHQEVVAEKVDFDPLPIFAEVLLFAHPQVQEWWRKAISAP